MGDPTVPTTNDPNTNSEIIKDYVTGDSAPTPPTPVEDTASHPDANRMPGDVWPREMPPGDTIVTDAPGAPGTITWKDAMGALGLGGAGSASLEAKLLEALLGKGAKKVNPEVASAAKYYFQLYGKVPPKGLIEGMVKQGMDVYSIQDALLDQARTDGAPGYDEIRYANLLSSGESMYFQLWGEDAPPDYIKGLVDSGMNLQEIMDLERSKPSFKKTQTYKSEADSLAAQLAQLLGYS